MSAYLPPMERLDPTEQELKTEDLLALVPAFSLPYSDEYEKGVICGALHDPEERLDTLKATVPPAAFYHFQYRAVYITILAMREKGIPLEIAAVTQKLREQKLLEKCGGPGGISELYTFLPASSHYEFYVSGIMEKLSLRLLMRASLLNLNAAANAGSDYVESDTNKILDDAEVRIRGVRSGTAVGEFTSTNAWMDRVTDSIEQQITKARTLTLNEPMIPGISTGLNALDERTGGFCPGHVWLVQAATSDGKTSFAIQAAMDLVLRPDPIPVTYYLTESSGEDFWRRCLAHITGIDLERVLTGQLTDPQWDAINRAATRLRASLFVLRHKPGMQRRELLADMRLIHRRNGKPERGADGRIIRRKMVFFHDYLQRFKGRLKGQQEHEHIQNVCADITDLTGTLQCTSVILAQLNEENKTRGSNSPAMDADVVTTIACPPAIDPATGKPCVKPGRYGSESVVTRKDESKRMFTFGKNRMGKRGGDALTFNFNGGTQTFS